MTNNPIRLIVGGNQSLVIKPGQYIEGPEEGLRGYRGILVPEEQMKVMQERKEIQEKQQIQDGIKKGLPMMRKDGKVVPIPDEIREKLGSLADLMTPFSQEAPKEPVLTEDEKKLIGKDKVEEAPIAKKNEEGKLILIEQPVKKDESKVYGEDISPEEAERRLVEKKIFDKETKKLTDKLYDPNIPRTLSKGEMKFVLNMLNMPYAETDNRNSLLAYIKKIVNEEVKIKKKIEKKKNKAISDINKDEKGVNITK